VHRGPTSGDGTGKIFEKCARRFSRHRIDRPRAELRELAVDLRIVVGDQSAGSTSPHFSQGKLLFGEGEEDRRKTMRIVAPKALIAIWL
jgi:hypothetical protein